VQAYFLEKDHFWKRPVFGKKYLILEHVQQVARKKHAEKEGKSACMRKSNVACSRTSLTVIRLGFLKKYCNGYRPIKGYK
jgi:hypothetical protein